MHSNNTDYQVDGLDEALRQQRSMLARDLHDILGSGLTSISLQLSWIEAHADSAVQDRARSARDQIATLVQSGQRLVRNLHGMPPGSDLIDRIEQMANQVQVNSSLCVRFDHDIEGPPLESEIDRTVYFVAMEALTNIQRHANATDVLISLLGNHESVSLEITDDGIGIPQEGMKRQSGYGIQGMKERADGVGGWIEVSSIAGAGTSVLLHIPRVNDADSDQAAKSTAPLNWASHDSAPARYATTESSTTMPVRTNA